VGSNPTRGNFSIVSMLYFFYKYRKPVIQRSYNTTLRVNTYMNHWAKWYFVVKHLKRHTGSIMPSVTMWKWRSLYLNRKHHNRLGLLKKSLLIHLFWVLDVWKLKQPADLVGSSNQFPVTFRYNITNPLETQSLLYSWVNKYGLNKDRLFSHSVTPSWLKFKPEQWMSRDYTYFVYWRDQQKKNFIRKNKVLSYLDRWFLDNRYYHSIQASFICKVPLTLPANFAKTLLMRVLRYPMLYNYSWFAVLKELTNYSFETSLPWSLLYKSKDVWTFDNRALGLEHILLSMLEQRLLITEYVIFKHWCNLLNENDPLSKMLQIYIRTSPIFSSFQHRKVNLQKL
jgi:hypothetical protein